MPKKPIWHMRLINGDEILCQIGKETDNEIVVKYPLVISEKVEKKTGKSNIVLSKYTLSKNSNLNLKQTHIVTKTRVHDEVENFYKSSLDYSKNVLEPNQLAEMQDVADMMNEMNKPNELIILAPATSTNFVDSGNSVN